MSVILKTRECSLPAMVNVFALVSTAEIIPWNGIARALLESVVVFAAAGELAVLGVGEALAFGEAEALEWAEATPGDVADEAR